MTKQTNKQDPQGWSDGLVVKSEYYFTPLVLMLGHSQPPVIPGPGEFDASDLMSTCSQVHTHAHTYEHKQLKII